MNLGREIAGCERRNHIFSYLGRCTGDANYAFAPSSPRGHGLGRELSDLFRASSPEESNPADNRGDSPYHPYKFYEAASEHSDTLR